MDINGIIGYINGIKNLIGITNGIDNDKPHEWI